MFVVDAQGALLLLATSSHLPEELNLREPEVVGSGRDRVTGRRKPKSRRCMIQKVGKCGPGRILGFPGTRFLDDILIIFRFYKASEAE